MGPALLLGLLASCSFVDRGPVAECESDEECGTGAVCSLAQGGICVPEVLPPRTALGFDIREGEVRLELRGCDPEISVELGGSELRFASHKSIVDGWDLRVSSSRWVDLCDETCSGSCDGDTLICSGEGIDAEFDLSATSRLGLAMLTSASKNYTGVFDPPLPEGELPPPVTFDWGRYDATDDPAALTAVRIDVAPPPDGGSRGSLSRVLAPDAGGLDELAIVSTQRCQRGIGGFVRALSSQDPIAGVTVDFLHDEPIAAPSTVVGGQGPSCAGDLECPPGWACAASTATCALDLDGLTAGSSTSLDDGSFMPAWLYTYCEGIDASEDPLVRDFIVRATPPAESGLPTSVFALAQEFKDPSTPGDVRNVPMTKNLCLPDWVPPHNVDFQLLGDPVVLLENDLGTYRCCSTECLPTGEPDVEPKPPPNVSSCTAFDRVRFETRWEPDMDEQFLLASNNCLTAAANNDGSAGRYIREVSECAPDEPCHVSLTAGDIMGDGRSYTYTITQPVGSVFRSYRASVEITGDIVDLGTLQLLPRVLLRGRIVCAEGNANCSATDAVFAAERLRAEDEDADAPGPFYYQARVDSTGQFLLPVDPGLYVVTAFPAVGQPGGPAPYEVIDLREGSPNIDDVDGIPNATISKPFELDDGVLVRVQLRDFDVSTTVTPLDIGSWTAQENFPYDLNDPDTCLGVTGRGCLIRRLRPSDAPISLLISKRLQFTTRDRGADQCPE
ncbi:MAG: hypothetical protein KC457_00850 [Myxococcales bacterium]|nr:hypothetical protein [Myxococcales bacterium]